MSILAIGGFVMKAYDYNGTIIPLGDSVRQVAYVECSCGCLASRVTSDSNKYKCSGVNEFTRLEKIIEQLDKLLNVLLLNWQNFNL